MRAEQLKLFGRSVRSNVRSASEFNIQCAVADTLRRFCADGWRWTHIPNGEARTAEIITTRDIVGRVVHRRRSQAGERLKRAGLKPGWPDILLISPGGVAFSLELKAHGGRLTEAQEQYRDECLRLGHPWACAWGYRQAIDTLTEWGALKTKVNVQ
jgi:hypothetical protein